MNQLRQLLSKALFRASTSSGNSGKNPTIEALTENSAFINGQFVESPPKIKIAQSSEITLNLTRFWLDFESHYDVYNGVTANVISIIINSGKYRVKISSNETNKVLNSSTLESVGEAPAFNEFKYGSEIMVVIGADRVENEEYIINPMWIGMVEITK